MAEFSNIFSTTFKVWLSLLIISAALGLGYLLLTVLLSHSSRAASNAPSLGEEYVDSIRTSMPESAWDAAVSRAVESKCVALGMNKKDVTEALGQPSQIRDYWIYEQKTDECLKYEGDTCIKFAVNSAFLSFTQKGNVERFDFGDLSGCKTVEGKSVYPNPFLALLATPVKKMPHKGECLKQLTPGGPLVPCR